MLGETTWHLTSWGFSQPSPCPCDVGQARAQEASLCQATPFPGGWGRGEAGRALPFAPSSVLQTLCLKDALYRLCHQIVLANRALLKEPKSTASSAWSLERGSESQVSLEQLGGEGPDFSGWKCPRPPGSPCPGSVGAGVLPPWL